ncbi:hypothetical protein ACTXT7_002122 [Hymenolepis weldensis]
MSIEPFYSDLVDLHVDHYGIGATWPSKIETTYSILKEAPEAFFNRRRIAIKNAHLAIAGVLTQINAK